HPVRLSFFPAISISMLLLSIVLMGLYPGLAKGFWIVGAALHLVLTVYVLSSWIHHTHYDIKHMSPAWFIPVVGNVVVPVAGVPLGFVEPSWFFFSLGLVFWIVLKAIVLYRIIFHHPMPDKLAPTLFIFIAPPAVAFLAYLKLTGGELDAFARVLYYTGLFLTILLLAQFPRFAQLKFFLSWWAYSFPLAAISIATFVMAEKTGLAWFETTGHILFAILNVVLALLVVRTIDQVLKKAICVEEA
ncbi:MAG: SLAC1 anion channel family protein, partial [Alphaproteobacteria bacterium]|nr:SLAC1 anion channel family protein [Alphaproteobacteria bacterium]